MSRINNIRVVSGEKMHNYEKQRNTINPGKVNVDNYKMMTVKNIYCFYCSFKE